VVRWYRRLSALPRERCLVLNLSKPLLAIPSLCQAPAKHLSSLFDDAHFCCRFNKCALAANVKIGDPGFVSLPFPFAFKSSDVLSRRDRASTPKKPSYHLARLLQCTPEYSPKRYVLASRQCAVQGALHRYQYQISIHSITYLGIRGPQGTRELAGMDGKTQLLRIFRSRWPWPRRSLAGCFHLSSARCIFPHLARGQKFDPELDGSERWN
jgi:hypothetical protein